jgi:hypothetical protein
MDTIQEFLKNTLAELLGRASGPLHFRIVMQPLVAGFFAVRAGMKDARDGRPPFFWTLLAHPHERQRALHSGWRDIGKIFIVALVLDGIYQAIELPAVRVGQALIVAVSLAILPYVLIRGPISRLRRGQ